MLLVVVVCFCLLCVDCCLLLVVRCSLCVACCVLIVVRFLLIVVVHRLAFCGLFARCLLNVVFLFVDCVGVAG